MLKPQDIKSNNREHVVENIDRPRSEGIWHVKEYKNACDFNS